MTDIEVADFEFEICCRCTDRIDEDNRDPQGPVEGTIFSDILFDETAYTDVGVWRKVNETCGDSRCQEGLVFTDVDSFDGTLA